MNVQHTFAIKRQETIRTNRQALIIVGLITLFLISITVLIAIEISGLSTGFWKCLAIIGLVLLISTDIICILLWNTNLVNNKHEIRLLDEIKFREHNFVDEEKSLQRYYTALIVSYIADYMLHPRIIIGDEGFYAEQDSMKLYSLYPIWRQLLRHGYKKGPLIIYEPSCRNHYGLVISGSNITLYYADTSRSTIYRTRFYTDTPTAEKLVFYFYETTSVDPSSSNFETFTYHFSDDSYGEFLAFMQSHS